MVVRNYEDEVDFYSVGVMHYHDITLLKAASFVI